MLEIYSWKQDNYYLPQDSGSAVTKQDASITYLSSRIYS